MEVNLELNERLYRDIENLSKESGISIEDYLTKIIEDKFYTDKYGDLNKIMNDDRKDISDKNQKNEQIIKKISNNEKNDIVLKITKNEDLKNESKETESTENVTDVKIKKRVSRTRTIKSK